MMDSEVEACVGRVCDHIRQSLARIGNLLDGNRRNTVSETDPHRTPNEYAVSFIRTY